MTLDQARKLTRQISSERNALRRNRAISRAYADVYLKRSSLRWAGMAAYVSNHVGCAMRKRLLGFCTTWFLGRGNRVVFEDIHPILLFYDDLADRLSRHELRRALSDPRIPSEVAQALYGLNSSTVPRDHRERESAEKILHYEQSVVLQPQVYESFWVRRIFQAAAFATWVCPRLLTVKFHSSCRESRPMYQVRPTRGLDLADLNQRWNFAQRVAQQFHALHDDAEHVLIVQQDCKNIARAS